MPDESDEIAALRDEVDRLQRLVGPNEQSYSDLQQDLLAARDAARGAEATTGALRGQNAELHVALARARQDQDHFQRMVVGRGRTLFGRMNRSIRARFF
jgi:predicted  nucleic acid-binding Zn-ribbon protein